MQFSPSNKLYGQALEKLKTLSRTYSSLRSRSVDEVASEVNNIFKEIQDQLNGPTLKYKQIEYGSVPSSFDMNVFLTSLAQDINVLIDELDITRAASVQTHNFIKTEMMKSEYENDKLDNQIKALQLYSASEDSSIIYVGDHFYNDEYIDWDRNSSSDRVQVIRGNQISLGVLRQISIMGNESRTSILEGSNGFIGNNQEVISQNIGDNIIFVGEEDTTAISNRLKYITDGQPTTVFEFEKYLVPPSNRSSAKKYNFTYRASGSEEMSYLSEFKTDSNEISWANGLTSGVLTLNILIDLSFIKKLNLVSFNPYGLIDNVNGPILISSVSISKDKSDWTDLLPTNIWVANTIDQNTVNINGENIVIGTAFFRAQGDEARYIRIKMEQRHAINVPIGHFYYTIEDEDLNTGQELERVEGPIPLVDMIWEEKNPVAAFQNDLIQRREIFNGQRWAIGIRDISAYSIEYMPSSTMISKKFSIPGGVDRVALEASITIPDSYSAGQAWVRFYISPDDGYSWHQISRIQDDFLDIPEIIAYNDNTPIEFRLPGVGYYETLKTPTSLRVKIEMDRDTGDNTLTPTVQSYKLKIKKRSI